MKLLLRVLVLSVVLVLLADRGEAAVYNLHLVTDKVPDYTDMPSLAHSTADLWQTPQDKAIAVWRWGRRSRRQTSCAAEDGRGIWDPILHFNSYGAMNCGIISSLNIASWRELGYRGRYIQLGDHTVSEVSWDDGKSWHLFDSSMSIFCYNHEGVVASCDEIQQAHACALSVDRYCQYARAGHRYTLGVRPYESYTRYWEPLDRPRRTGRLAAGDPDYFRPISKGFSESDDPRGPMDIRGNGQWVFQPELAAKNWRESFYDDSGLEADGGGRHTMPHQNRDARGG